MTEARFVVHKTRVPAKSEDDANDIAAEKAAYYGTYLLWSLICMICLVNEL